MTIYLLIFALITKLTTILSYDLCSNSRVDSIAYIDDTRQYFITSGGYYWLVKENEMPPKTGGKAMPDGWSGDASAYINTLKGCENSSKVATEQQVLVLEKDMYKLFDVRSLDWKHSGNRFEYNKINRIHIDWTKPVDAMFDLNTYEVYIVQGDKYGGADWSKLCTGLTDLSEAFKPENAKTDFETQKKIDAIFFKYGVGLYVFTGDEFYILPLDLNISRRGKILRQSKSSIKSVRKDFFNCSGSMPVKPPEPRPEPTGDGQPGKPDITEKPEAGGDEENKKGGKGLMWIIIGIVLLVIVLAMIAFLVFMALRKRKSDAASSKVKSSKATSKTSGISSQSKISAKSSKKSPSKFSTKSTSPSKMSYRSNLYN